MYGMMPSAPTAQFLSAPPLNKSIQPMNPPPMRVSLASMICDALTQDGHSAEVAGNGSDALIRLEQERFDLVISDVRMPGMDGERLYEELQRSRPELCERLVLTTGDTLGTEPGRIAARTGLNVLHKPFDLDQLRRLVRERLTPDISS